MNALSTDNNCYKYTYTQINGFCFGVTPNQNPFICVYVCILYGIYLTIAVHRDELSII